MTDYADGLRILEPPPARIHIRANDCEVCGDPMFETPGRLRCAIHDAMSVQHAQGYIEIVCDELCAMAIAPIEDGSFFERVRPDAESVLRNGPATWCAICGDRITEGAVA